MNIVVSTRHLPEIAESIKAKYAEGRRLNESQADLYLAIGRDLADARMQFTADQEYGRWFAAQDFGFSLRWGHTLRLGAENEPAVRAAVGSQLLTGNQPNFEKAVKQAINPTPIVAEVVADEPESDLFRNLVAAIDSFTEVRSYEPTDLAASVPQSKREGVAKALDKAGLFFGRVAYSIRQEESK